MKPSLKSSPIPSLVIPAEIVLLGGFTRTRSRAGSSGGRSSVGAGRHAIATAAPPAASRKSRLLTLLRICLLHWLRSLSRSGLWHVLYIVAPRYCRGGPDETSHALLVSLFPGCLVLRQWLAHAQMRTNSRLFTGSYKSG